LTNINKADEELINVLVNFVKKKGVIFDVQRYSIHDGPGIRTIVFFKGCPLRCLWCSNPESQKSVPEILYSHIKCKNCNKCILICPKKAISDNKGIKGIDYSLCDNCGKCVEACPNEALEMAGRLVSIEEIMKEVEKDIIFYRSSDGGVTLSGGECIYQSEFSICLLAEARKRGIHTAIETTGFQKWDILENILQYVDLVFYDLKYIDPIKHLKYAGVNNKLILENAQRIISKKIPMIVRIPVIPKYTDSKENIKAIAKFVSNLKEVKKIELLPYHRMGELKYKKLGRKYELEGVSSPSNEQMQELARIVKSYGLEVQIGG